MRAKPRGSRSARRGWFGFAALAVTLATTLIPSGMAAGTVDVPVSARLVSQFKVDSPEKRFGKLQFVGGLVMRSPEPLFGAISSIRFMPDGRSFLAVLDTGHFLSGTVERHASGDLSGLSQVRIAPMLDKAGHEAKRKREMDSEGLALRGNRAFVSYEQRPRIMIYSTETLDAAKPIGQLPHLIPDDEFRRNAGMETIAVSPADGPLRGSMVVVAEASFDGDGNLFAAILEGPRKGLFSVAHDHSYSVTDGAFLPDGDLLLLERRFELSVGVGMRIRRIKADTIRPGAVVDGEVLIEADLSDQIDNMEGMDVIKAADGSTHLILVSDDNHSFLQRNMMLEFKLLN
ncbi:hypothetical protein GGQ73_001151 [Rhizobium skierniewicense]|uniref:Phytase-like domain-containing protein n=2 Tax=Rhizobium skierniewicense TaxID=984260 RepID=A0A7W6C3T1_9HYPH|nr:hypothetical protein [Rhizobium skierniewicense]